MRWFMRGRFGLAAWWTVLVMGCAGQELYQQVERSPAAKERPNLVVFVADDMGWNDIGYHNQQVCTPNLDRLAETGVRLEQFYVYPTCSPTRAAFLTGRCPSRWGILEPIMGRSEQALPADTLTLAGRLRRLGYTTGITGKWHLGCRPQVGPTRYGFDFSYGYLHGQVDPYTHLYKTGDKTWHRNDVFVDEAGHVTDLIAREASSFIEKNEHKPFFLYVPFSVPHTPLAEPEEWTRPYEGRIGNASRRWFAGSITHMDAAIGQICATVDRLGLRDNTLIVFFSDNGGQDQWSSQTEYDGRYPPHDQLGDNRPLRGWKGELYEGGIRVPALANWRGRLAPRVNNDVVSVLDLFPTLVAVAQERQRPGEVRSAEPAESLLEGTNVWSALVGKATTGPRELYWRTPEQRALRAGDFKLIETSDGQRRELFNLADDPYEQHDLAEQQPQRVRELWEKLKAQQAKDPDGADGR